MEKKVNSILVLLVWILAGSCSLEKDREGSEYKSEDLYRKKIGQYTFSLKPFDPQRLLEVNYGQEISSFPKERADSIINEYKNYLCFVFELDIDGFKGDIADYEESETRHDFDQRANYYLFGMQRDLKLRSNTGLETPCTIYYYERLNEIARTNRFIIGFQNPKASQVTLEYTNPYFNCGKINFSIQNNSLALN